MCDAASNFFAVKTLFNRLSNHAMQILVITVQHTARHRAMLDKRL
jgi:hypothetical protein